MEKNKGDTMPKIEDMGEVRGFDGEWIVVVDGKVVASSDDEEKMFRFANKYSNENVIVTKVLSANASFY